MYLTNLPAIGARVETMQSFALMRTGRRLYSTKAHELCLEPLNPSRFREEML